MTPQLTAFADGSSLNDAARQRYLCAVPFPIRRVIAIVEQGLAVR